MIQSSTMNFLCLLLGSVTSLCFAQDKKVFISNMEEVYTYDLNKNEEAQIQAEHIITYKCIHPTNVSFVEYYDDFTEIKNVKIKGAKGVFPKYGMYRQETIFFSDDKACYFDIPLVHKDSEATVLYNTHYKDIRRLIVLPLAVRYYTNSRTIKICIPDWLNIDLVNQNLAENVQITVSRDESKETTTTTIHITNQSEYFFEDNSPPYIHSQPYIMMVPRQSLYKNRTTNYFKTVDDLYQWSIEPLSLMDTNWSVIKEKASEITKNCNSDEEKIRELCKWVQRSIRYIAFVDGINAYKPDNPQDVIIKKYGDCKGMSNLLKSLLVAEGFDARLVWVATSESGMDLDIQNPMPFANHMICALYKEDSLYYFDPTIQSLCFGEIPEQIQGQMALIENGEKYIVSRIPPHTMDYNRDSLFIQYAIIDDKLMGEAKRTFKGESKHTISYWMNAMSETEKRYKTEEFLKNGENGDSIYHIQTQGLDSFVPEINLTYTVNRKSNLNIFGNKIYVNLDETKDFQDTKIDSKKRKTPLKFQHKEYIVRVSEFLIPTHYEVKDLPENTEMIRENYSFSISYTMGNGKILYRKELFIFNSIIEPTEFEQWNSDIDTLRKIYGERIVLEKKQIK